MMNKIPIRQIRTEKEPDLSENFSIREVKQMLAGKDMVQELHRHDHYFILALKKGKGQHVVDFKEYKIIDNSVFFLCPGQVHQLLLKSGSTGYLMQFNNGFYLHKEKSSTRLLRTACTKNFCQPSFAGIKRIFTILNTVYEEYTERKAGYKEIIKAELGIFFIELIRQRQSKNSSRDSSLYAQERIDELFELLETHIAQKKQVSEYADMMKLTVYQLNSITKASLGKTCSQLINEHIILESKRNLLATASQVNQVAYLLGYEDISYFIRFFKKHTGVTPKSFREKFK